MSSLFSFLRLLFARVDPTATGSCSQPYPLKLDDNPFDNAPASGVNLTSTCTTKFGTSYDSVYYRFTPNVTGLYTLSTCNQVSQSVS